MKYALIGEKLSHSFSKPIHEMFGNSDYEIVEVAKENLEDFILNSDYKGLNVTIPYKKDVMKYCNTLSEAAINIGSVNTLIKKGDQIHGDNTDLYGFLSSADSAGIDFNGKKVVIFGSGGTCNTVKYAVASRGGNLVIISRTGENNYENISKHYDAQIIINTTPVGMFPNFEDAICDLVNFPLLKGVIDVVYNPIRTRLILQAESLGIKHIGGLHMLVSQAKRAEELFFGREIDVLTESIIEKIESDKLNIAIVGMPGSGKTTIGKLVANKLGMDFFDTDKEIEVLANMTIPEIFEKFGEKHFRKLESECIKKASTMKQTVISTGGGAILSLENRANLKMNSKVVLIIRDIEKLATNGRPLSIDLSAVKRLFEIRMPIYKEVADIVVSNNGSIDEAVSEIERSVFCASACD